MATLEECRDALVRLSAKMGGAEGDVGTAVRLDRSVSCRLTDLAVTLSGRLRDGALHDVTDEGAPSGAKAQIRLTMASDDLVALVDGDLNFASAWARGRVKLDASFRDLLVLRKLL